MALVQHITAVLLLVVFSVASSFSLGLLVLSFLPRPGYLYPRLVSLVSLSLSLSLWSLVGCSSVGVWVLEEVPRVLAKV